MWDPGWNNIFKEHEWGKYPPEEVVRAVAREFFKVSDRGAVSILEIGSGTGANLWFAAREGFKAYGIDGSQVAVDKCLERFKKEGLKAEIIVGDAMKLPYPHHFFNAVLDVECLYSNSEEDALRMLEEVDRVLKPGGLFFSKTFMKGTHEGALKKGYGLIRYSTENDVKKLYSKVFKIEKLDQIVRTENNGAYEIKEWLVTCRKKQ